MMICRRAGRLDDEDVLTANILIDSSECFPVWEGLNGAFARFDSNGITDGVGELWIGATREDLHGLGKRGWVGL